MVPVALASGSDLPGNPHSPGSGNPTAVVRFSDCPHYPSVAGSVFDRDPVGSPPGASRHPPGTPDPLVCQAETHLLRCDCVGATETLASSESFHLSFTACGDYDTARLVCGPQPCRLLWLKLDKVELWPSKKHSPEMCWRCRSRRSIWTFLTPATI